MDPDKPGRPRTLGPGNWSQERDVTWVPGWLGWQSSQFSPDRM